MEKKSELTKLQKTILTQLSKSPLKDDFYWTGGTALAFFYLSHRLSFDIDLFSDRPFQYETIIPLVKTIVQTAKLSKIQERKIHDRWEFWLKNQEETRLDFVYYDFPTLAKRKKWRGVWVDSLKDMAANKTMALIDRHDPKDAFDIYFILTKTKFTPEKLLQLVEKKFGAKFPVSLFWSQCLLGARELPRLKPLIPGLNQNQLFEKIINYFEKKSTKDLRALTNRA